MSWMPFSRFTFKLGFSAVTPAAIALALIACSSHESKDSVPATSRAPAQAYAANYEASAAPSAEVSKVLQADSLVRGGQVEFPPGLNAEEAADFWHLGEGSEVFPLKWFINLKSQLSTVSGESKLSERLDEKYGVIKDPLAENHDYPLKWVGLTSAWSAFPPKASDVHSSQPLTVVAQQVQPGPDGFGSIAMVGVNCTFCHSSQVRVGGTNHFLEGAPNMVSMRGFFRDMFGSTVQTMCDPKLLEEFFRASGVSGDVHEKAENFSRDFRRSIGISKLDDLLSYAFEEIDPVKFNAVKEAKVQPKLFAHREEIYKALAELLKITYGLPELSPELEARMRWLSVSIGFDPNLKATPEGYGRTDAFARISNLIARKIEPIPATATVSVPPMWGAQYRSVYHYNGNTNSVIMRNIGQSFGLGATLIHPEAKNRAKYDSTSNMHNLHKIESLLYKVQVPNGGKIFADTGIDQAKVVNGCNLFYNRSYNKHACALCHEPNHARTGPGQTADNPNHKPQLIDYKLISLKAIGTDDLYLRNQATPIKVSQDGTEVPFRTGLFTFTGNIRDQYFYRNEIGLATQKEWERSTIRGTEIFRDTYFGEQGHEGPDTYMNNPGPYTHGYIARGLSGAWSTGPFLHNGSVPTIADLLKPVAQRPKVFFVGSREIDTRHLGFVSDISSIPDHPALRRQATEKFKNMSTQERNSLTIEDIEVDLACKKYWDRCYRVSDAGNSNKGHEFGLSLTMDQKESLIEFLKVLRPEVEYSWTSAPQYALHLGNDGAITCSAP